MQRAGARVGTGTRFTYDGEVIEGVEMHTVAGMPEVLARDLRNDTVRRFALDELMYSARSHALSEDLRGQPHARPVLPHGKLHPSRPGEYLLMDTTHLDAFGGEPTQ
jgi:hypothetical protein